MGAWVAGLSAGAAVLAAFVLRTRVPAAASIAVLGLAGAGLGWGGMLLRPDPSPGEVAAAIVLLALLVPAHVRIVLGRFGPARRDEPTLPPPAGTAPGP